MRFIKDLLENHNSEKVFLVLGTVFVLLAIFMFVFGGVLVSRDRKQKPEMLTLPSNSYYNRGGTPFYGMVTFDGNEYTYTATLTKEGGLNSVIRDKDGKNTDDPELKRLVFEDVREWL